MKPDFRLQISTLIRILTECDANYNAVVEITKEDFAETDFDKKLIHLVPFFEEQGILKGQYDENYFFDIQVKKEKCLKYILKISDEFREEQNNILKEIQVEQEKIIIKQSGEIETKKRELEAIYGFLPENIVKEVNESKVKLSEILTSIDKSEYLIPLKPKIQEIGQYLEKTEKVIKNYEDIYLNIVKPIKSEGKQGINATTRWAIFSIIITTIVSFYFSFKVNKDTTNLTDNQVIYSRLSNTDSSKMERMILELHNKKEDSILKIVDKKVSAISLKLLGYDDNYKPDTTEILIIHDIFADAKYKLLVSEDKTISVTNERVGETIIKGKIVPYVSLKFYLNESNVGASGLKDILKVEDKADVLNIDPYDSSLRLTEGNVIWFFDRYKFKIIRIYRTESNILKITDNKNAVLLKKIE